MSNIEDSTLIQSRSALFVLQEKTLSLLGGDGRRQNASFSLATGAVVEQKYDILQMLGEGGMGVVYKAHHRLLDKVVALKTFKTSQIDEETTSRFQLEARALGKLSHPNIVQIFDYGTTESKMPYYTMEYLEGETLADLLRRKEKLSISEIVGIVFQICHGLSAAHLKGILHRDLKPSNIFLTALGVKQYKVSVVDFGLAMMTSAQVEEPGTNVQDVICGSPLYMSPEQGRGEPLTVASDIYSLGCTMYECLTGRAPFIGSNSLHTMMMRESETAPTLSQHGGGKEFPPQLEKIVATMLQKDPSRRQPSIEIVLDDLDYFARSHKKAKRKAASALVVAEAERGAEKAGAERPDENRPDEDRPHRQNIWLWPSIAASAFAMSMLVYVMFAPHAAPPTVSRPTVVAAPKPVSSSTALPVCSISADGEYSTIEWPGHAIGKEIDQPFIQRDKFVWKNHHVSACISFSDEFCGQPANFRTLRSVFVPKIYFSRRLTRAQLCEILKNLNGQRQLKDLHFERQPLDDTLLPLLDGLPDLTDLTLTYATKISGGALGRYAVKRQLHSLTYDFGNRATELIEKLAADKRLYYLSLTGAAFSAYDLKNITAISSVSNLRLQHCGITDEKLKLLTRLKYVWALRVDSNPLTPACITTLASWGKTVDANSKNKFRPILTNDGSWQEADVERLKQFVPLAEVEGFSLYTKNQIFDKTGDDFLRDSFK